MRSLALRLVPERLRDDDGVALPFIAAILVLLLGMSAFAIDLGWIYLNGARLQRAADSSALAGVVFLPADIASAESNAVNGANANGWDVGSVNGTPVVGGGPDDLEYRQLDDNRLEVTLSAGIPTYFLKVLGFDQISLTRTATAEYIKPVPLGSPFNYFGDGSDNIWGAINGRWTAWMQGDPFNARCDWSRGFSQSRCIDSSNSNTGYFPGHPLQDGDIDSNTDPLNPQFDGRGYAYGVEVQDGDRTSLQVELYDPRFQRPSGSGCGNNSSNPTGDCDRLTFSPPAPNSAARGPTTRYTLYEPDGTPLDPHDNSVAVCSRTFTPTTNSGASGVNEWVNLCSSPISNPSAGIYVLRVTATNGTGSNQYGVRVTTNGPGPDTPRVYGINYLSIFTNQPATTGTLYLAEVDPVHAGKALLLRFYDAGEDDAAAGYRILEPDGSTANCEWESDDGQSGGPGACQIDTTRNSGGTWEPRFNAQWLEVIVEIPDTYDCDIADPLACWWRVEITNSQPHDRTTWTAQIVGNPVRLVPNE